MDTDFCIIGGGIAGLSIAAELSRTEKVLLLEQEKDLGYHTSGRSAALYSEVTADSTALLLSQLSRSFFLEPPPGFTDNPLQQKCSCLFTAAESAKPDIERYSLTIDGAQVLGPAEVLKLVPVLRIGDDTVAAGLLETGAFRIDVAALIAGYRKLIKANSGEIRADTAVTAIETRQDGWQLQSGDGEVITAGRIINAAGAWADEVAAMAGVEPLGLTPYRRTMIVFDAPGDVATDDWPAVGGINGGYYFLPESGRLMGSAADEVESAPCDAQPGEYDIALAAHNIEAVTKFSIERVLHSWAGLRTFSPDRQLVSGYDPGHPGFFWHAGQGGFGMQTAPAAARAGALLARGHTLGEEFTARGIAAEDLSRQRFTRSTTANA